MDEGIEPVAYTPSLQPWMPSTLLCQKLQPEVAVLEISCGLQDTARRLLVVDDIEEQH